MKIRNVVLTLGTLIAAGSSAFAVTTFTETFDTNASNWLNAASLAPIYHATGGVDNSGYISYIAPDFNSGGGSMGGDPLTLMFRGNAANDASGDAFVGNWISGGIETFSIAVRHNYSTSLNLYSRIAGAGGAGASLANVYTIAPDTWTTIEIPIVDGNPPFISYGSSNFEGAFNNVQNLQIGLYLPANTDITGLRMDIDNVSIVAVPEPATVVLLGFGGAAVVLGLRRRRNS